MAPDDLSKMDPLQLFADAPPHILAQLGAEQVSVPLGAPDDDDDPSHPRAARRRPLV